MADAMSDARLAEIRDEVTGPCSCCGYDKHDFDEPYALELLDEVDRLRAQLAEIGNFTVQVDVQAESDDASLRFVRQAIRVRRDYEDGEER